MAYDSQTLDDAKLAALEASLGLAQTDILLEMLAQEARDAPLLVGRLVAAGNLTAIAAEGHALMGAAFGLGARRLGEAARAVERIGAVDEGPALVEAFSDAALATLSALDERRARSRSERRS